MTLQANYSNLLMIVDSLNSDNVNSDMEYRLIEVDKHTYQIWLYVGGKKVGTM